MKFLLWWRGKRQSGKICKNGWYSRKVILPQGWFHHLKNQCEAGWLPSSLLERDHFAHPHSLNFKIFFKAARLKPASQCKAHSSFICSIETLEEQTELPCFCLFKHFSYGRGQNFHFINEISTSRLRGNMPFSLLLLNSIALERNLSINHPQKQ